MNYLNLCVFRNLWSATVSLIVASALLSSAEVLTVADDVTHSFLACGGKTYILDEQGKKTWTYPHSTRDGYVLPNGNVLLALSKSKAHPGGAVVEVTRDGEETMIWQGKQSEVNSAQPTDDNTIVITEAGEKPRLLEMDRQGKVLNEFPLQCQLNNHHMQTRMARKLTDGTFLAPHLFDFAVYHYDESGKLLGKLDTTVPGDTEHNISSWPFTAIRHGDGQTLVCCTHSNRVVEFNSDGNVDWLLTNDDLPGPWLQDPCGGQVLPNGNIVITSYGGGGKNPAAPKLMEFNRDKEVVWTYSNGERLGIHHFQILTTNGKKLDGPVLN